jgi:hypothetical protein
VALLFSFCGHTTSFVAARDELASALGASVDIAASSAAPSTSPVHSTMSMVPPIGATVPPRIVIGVPPSAIERLSMWMVGQLGTPARHTTSAVPFRMPRVLPHDPVKSLSDTFVGTLDAAVPTLIAPGLRVISPVPLAITMAAALDSSVRSLDALVGPTMPPVPIADAMVAPAMSPVHGDMSSVGHHASSNRRLCPSVHALAHPMRSPSAVRPPVGRRAGAMLIIAAERRPTTARPKAEGRVV